MFTSSLQLGLKDCVYCRDELFGLTKSLQLGLKDCVYCRDKLNRILFDSISAFFKLDLCELPYRSLVPSGKHDDTTHDQSL